MTTIEKEEKELAAFYEENKKKDELKQKRME